MSEEEKKDSPYVNSGFIIGGGMLFGMGAGYLFDNVRAFMFMGLGAGLVIAAMTQVMIKNKNK